MKNINQFITDAIAGGYLYHGDKLIFDELMQWWVVSDGDGGYGPIAVAELLLDPKFWQSVGKTKGLERALKMSSAYGIRNRPVWRDLMHCFIDHLADGKSIDEALSLIK